MHKSRLLTGVVVLLGLLAGCSDSTGPGTPEGQGAALAKGGGGGTTVSSRCASIAVTNNPQSVRHSIMPDIRYNLENCGTNSISVTVSVTEGAGFLSVLCPSPVAAPAQYTLGLKQKISATAPVYRGPCGMTSNVNGVLRQGINAWQGHNLVLTVTDDSTGAVLSTGFFNWQDVLNAGV